MKYLYSPRTKTVFGDIPKCGVESLRLLILKENNDKNKHDIWKMSRIYNPQIPRNMLTKFNYIVIVRNPYNRLVSGFLDKFMTGNYNHLQFCKQIMNIYANNANANANGNNSLNGNNCVDIIKNRINFEEFVNILVKIPHHKVDEHFRSQLDLFDPSPNIKLFRLEELKTNGFDKYLKISGFTNKFENYRVHHLYMNTKKDIKNAHKMYYNDFDIAEKRYKNNDNVKPNGASGIGFDGCVLPKYDNFYTPELKRKVYEYYKKDFVNLGYKM